MTKTDERPLAERAYELFAKMMGDEFKVIERLAPSPLPQIIEAFIAWLEKEIEKERERERQPLTPQQPYPWQPAPPPTLPPINVPVTRPKIPWGDSYPQRPWAHWYKAARTWADSSGAQYDDDADLIVKYAKYMAGL